jgi:hypothetical protein
MRRYLRVDEDLDPDDDQPSPPIAHHQDPPPQPAGNPPHPKIALVRSRPS